jgi:hypothetical protein
MVYGLLIYQGSLPHMAQLICLAVTASIVVYSSTDVLIRRWFQRRNTGEEKPVG